jgi:flagellar biogenesis protein FliO
MTTLVIVTVLLGALALVLRKRTGATGRVNAIRVPARAALHRGATIAIVEIDGRRLLVGAGAQGVSLITELDAHPGSPVIEAPRRRDPLPSSGRSPRHIPSPLSPNPRRCSTTCARATTRTADPVARQARLPLRKGATP